MSEDNVEVVRRGYEAFARGDLESLERILRDVLDPEFEYQAVLVERVFKGFAGMRAFLSELRDVWTDYIAEPEEFIDLGGDVVVMVRLSARGTSSGVPVAGRLAVVYSFKDEKLLQARSFRSRAAALEAVGLRE